MVVVVVVVVDPGKHSAWIERMVGAIDQGIQHQTNVISGWGVFGLNVSLDSLSTVNTLELPSL